MLNRQIPSITIIGTSHIAMESIREIKEIIQQEKPGIVALELDKRRIAALMDKKERKFSWRDIWHMGFKGLLFALIGSWIQKKLGKIAGVEPGQEMLTAVKEARKRKAKIALIDQNIEITLQKFSQKLSWREKWHMVQDVLKGIFFRKQELERLGLNQLDLQKVPSQAVIRKLTHLLRERYPNIYEVLVAERNVIMARHLAALQEYYPKERIVAVMGAGHVEGVVQLLKHQGSLRRLPISARLSGS
ncbi:TraB/GumN family protein [Candidatus Woesearchaeota archaeon]|nr:TraB/GumN family protein [Candidatus Woesearchaeota archaeon]